MQAPSLTPTGSNLPSLNSEGMGELAKRCAMLQQQCRDAWARTDRFEQFDFRRTAFAKIGTICDDTVIALMFQARCLMQSRFWRQPNGIIDIPRTITDQDIQVKVEGFFGFIRTAFTHLVFSQVETTFRAFLRTIAPGTVGDGTGEFKSIYECLLRTYLPRAEGWDSEIVALDFFRVIRNLIHNNGFYLNRRAANVQIEHRGKLYFFQHNQHADFLPLPVVFDVVEDIIRALDQIIWHPKISGYSSAIHDPVVRNLSMIENG